MNAYEVLRDIHQIGSPLVGTVAGSHCRWIELNGLTLETKCGVALATFAFTLAKLDWDGVLSEFSVNHYEVRYGTRNTN